MPRIVWKTAFTVAAGAASSLASLHGRAEGGQAPSAARALLFETDALLRQAGRAGAGVTGSPRILEIFKEDAANVTLAACRDRDARLVCDFGAYSARPLTESNVESYELLGGDPLRSVFALKKSGDAALVTDFEVFCFADRLPKLFKVPADVPFSNAAFEQALAKIIDEHCKKPDLANAKAFLLKAVPLLARTCEVEHESSRSQLMAKEAGVWRGAPGECDAARYDLTADNAKTLSLARTPIEVSGGDRCEEVFGDPLAFDADDSDLAAGKGAGSGSSAKMGVRMTPGFFDLAPCDYLRWGETIPIMAAGARSSTPEAKAKRPDSGGDKRFEEGMMALFEGETDQAVTKLAALSKADPKHGMARLALGVARERKGEAAAMADFTAAADLLRGKPLGHSLDGRAVALIHRAATEFTHQKGKEALADLDEAVRLEPAAFAAHYWRANVLVDLKRDAEAATAFRRAIALRQSFGRITEFVFGEFGDAESMLADFVTPPEEEMLNAAAWRLAVSKDPKARDGAAAVRFAKEAVDRSESRNGRYLDTLAVAYAASGSYKEAVETETHAIDELMTEGADPEEKAAMDARLKLFKTGKPYGE